jgi:SPP1 family predicted phage head-tail adaptor
MSARQFNKRIEVWQTRSADDGYGGQTVADNIITTTWANIKTPPSQVVSDLGQDYGKGVLSVTVRNREDFQYNNKLIYIKYRDVKYTISSFPINDNFIDGYISFLAVQEKPSNTTVYETIP